MILTETQPGGLEGALSEVGKMVPIAAGIVIGLLIAAGKILGGGADVVTQWLAEKRRVADTRRDGVLDAMQEQIDGLKTIVEQLQDDVRTLRREHAEADAYGWRSYGEIQRLAPGSRWPMPPSAYDKPTTIADVQPPGD